MARKIPKNEIFNSFQIIGTCLTELIEETDAHGKKNYTLQIKTDGEYPVEVKVHFYSLNSELTGMSYIGRKVRIDGSVQGKIYMHNKSQHREWLQLRGRCVRLCDCNKSSDLEDMESAIITEDDLPF